MAIEVGEKIEWLGTEAIIVGCAPNTVVPALVLDITKNIDLPIRTRSMGQNKDKMWSENIRANIAWMSHGINELAGKGNGKTCIIAGSGPSLQVDYLKALHRKDVDVIACNAAYKLLGGNAKYGMFLDGAHMPIMDTWWSDVKPNSEAIMGDMVNPKAPKAGWSKIYWCGVLPRIPGVPENQGVVDKYGATALPLNVSFSALHIAYQMGYKKIIFAGCDFAYTNGYNHHGELAKHVPGKQRLDWYCISDSIQGGLTLTDEILQIQARMHEAGAWFLTRAGIEVINCTEGGSLMGIPCDKLQDCIGEVKNG